MTACRYRDLIGHTGPRTFAYHQTMGREIMLLDPDNLDLMAHQV